MFFPVKQETNAVNTLGKSTKKSYFNRYNRMHNEYASDTNEYNLIEERYNHTKPLGIPLALTLLIKRYIGNDLSKYKGVYV